MKKVVIAGATGLIGELLAKKLHELGYGLYILTRNIKKSQKMFSYAIGHFDWQTGNEWLAAIDSSDVVINLAGASIAGKRWNDSYKKEIYDSRILGTRKIVDALNQSSDKERVLISASAVGYYGDRGDDILDEYAPAANDFLAKVCVDWESEAQKATKARVVIPRIGVVLSEKGGALKEMLTPFKMNVGGPLGGGKQWWAWIHIDDLINMIAWVIENKEVEGPINAVAPKPVTNKYFSKALGKVLNKPSFMPIPKFALSIVLGESASFVLSSLRVIPRKALEYGFTFKFEEPETAIADLLK